MATVTPTRIAVLVATLIGAAVVLLFSVSIYAQKSRTTIQWNPQTISEALTFGETKILPITFTTEKNISKVAVRVSPEIAAYVTASPAHLKQIRKGTTTTITLTLSIPQNAQPIPISGTIALEKVTQQGQENDSDGDDKDDDSDSSKRGKKKTVGVPLPVTIEIAVEKLPPDPGEAGKATVEGTDSDQDGVRDDVQRYIVLTVPESARHREALKNVARVTQRELLAQSKEEAIQAAIAGVRSIECLSYLGVRKQRRWKEVEALMLNTEARLLAMDVHNDRITGQVFGGLPFNLKRTACTFDVEASPN